MTPHSSRHRPRPSRWRLLLSAVITAALPAALPPVAGAATDGTGSRDRAKHWMKFEFADPDTIRVDDGYVSYATQANVPDSCKGGGEQFLVPFVESGGRNPHLAKCPTGDALASIGDWADPKFHVWAPSVVRLSKNWYVMYYTAVRKGTGQRCIGRAASTSPTGPFRWPRVAYCPTQGSGWAIDADAMVSPKGDRLITFRDDSRSGGADTAIVAARLTREGDIRPGTLKTLLTSDQLNWVRAGTGVDVVENPSLGYFRKRYMLTFSGADWRSTNYASGLADCRSNVFRGCTILGGKARAYFGHKPGPRESMPGNPRGPGGVSFFDAPGGRTMMVYHHLSGAATARYAAFAEFAYDPNRDRYSATKP